MAIPEVIRVARDGGNYSSCMGDYDLHLGDESNQFWGRVVAFHTKPPANGYPERRWYAVRHKFDAWGRHLGTDHWFAGVDRPWGDAPELANAKVGEMLAALGEVEFGDIEIRLFRVEIDGRTFGLVDVRSPRRGRRSRSGWRWSRATGYSAPRGTAATTPEPRDAEPGAAADRGRKAGPGR